MTTAYQQLCARRSTEHEQQKCAKAELWQGLIASHRSVHMHVSQKRVHLRDKLSAIVSGLNLLAPIT